MRMHTAAQCTLALDADICAQTLVPSRSTCRHQSSSAWRRPPISCRAQDSGAPGGRSGRFPCHAGTPGLCVSVASAWIACFHYPRLELVVAEAQRREADDQGSMGSAPLLLWLLALMCGAQAARTVQSLAANATAQVENGTDDVALRVERPFLLLPVMGDTNQLSIS